LRISRWNEKPEAAGSLELEEVYRRAALLAREVESHAGAGLDLGFDGGMADDACKDQGGGVKRQISVPGLGDNCRVCGAMLWDGRKRRTGGLGGLHDPGAVVRAVASAAGREIRIG
jgi:hypothetical protein